MSDSIRFPEMRLQVIAALRSLSDRQHQEARWGRFEEGVNYYDDLSINVHILYDDCMVLPEPQGAVAEVLYQDEVPSLRDLENALGPMIHDLGDQPDHVYINDPRWLTVVETAARTLVIMQQIDEGMSSGAHGSSGLADSPPE